VLNRYNIIHNLQRRDVYKIVLWRSLYNESYLRLRLQAYTCIIETTQCAYARLFKKSTTFSWVGLGLKIGVIMMLLSPLLKLINFNLISSAHVFYIGGLTLITVMVATRVSLAHSETSLDYELRSTRIAFTICLLVASTIARWLANYELGLWLILSIVLFVISFLIWLDKHLRLILTSKIQKDS
jgi:uncharacterized protein involved in response to NO